MSFWERKDGRESFAQCSGSNGNSPLSSPHPIMNTSTHPSNTSSYSATPNNRSHVNATTCSSDRSNNNNIRSPGSSSVGSSAMKPSISRHSSSARCSSTKICGHDIYFPDGKVPFSAQKSVISKALIALNKGQNALLESPTGTGKTLALLTSTLAWQKKHAEEVELNNENNHQKGKGLRACSGPSPAREVDSFNQEQDNSTLENGNQANSTNEKAVSIYFCARTHSQLQQSIDELRSCHESYLENLSMCVLSSRKNLCVNDEVLDNSKKPVYSAGYESIDEGCTNRLKNFSCRFSNIHSMEITSEALAKTGVWDIEDAVHLGRRHKSCPYYVARKLHGQQPSITFAPYSYVLNSAIRSTVGINLRNSIIVFDEAHNIESSCREEASCEITLSTFRRIVAQLSNGGKKDSCPSPMSYKALNEAIAPLVKWLETVVQLYSSDNENASDYVWGGDEILDILSEKMQLTPSTLEMFRTHLSSVVAAEEEAEALMMEKVVLWDPEKDNAGQESGVDAASNHGALDSFVLQALKELFRIFDYMLRRDARFIDEYKMVVLTKNIRAREEAVLNLWCMSAQVVFEDFLECHSVILTSGTLSPLDSFSAELGVEFPVKVEAKHVIDTDSQVLASAVCKCGDVDLKCTYSFQNSSAYQDALGSSLLAIRRSSQAGMLVFFSSYGLMDKVMERWSQTGLLDAFEADHEMSNNQQQQHSRSRGKALFVEPRETKHLDVTLSEYYSRVETGQPGLLFAVCRGKVSEGIDFADDYARTVCVVGIPYPSIMDLQVKLKRAYQDNACKKRKDGGNILSGSKWYAQEAFRAINQAVGRCIRHIKDFGAVILLDPRFGEVENQNQLSKWIRGRIKVCEQVSNLLIPLRSFHQSNEEKFRGHLERIRSRSLPAPSLQASKSNNSVDSSNSGIKSKDSSKAAFIEMFKGHEKVVSSSSTHAVTTTTAGETTPKQYLGGAVTPMSEFSLDCFVIVGKELSGMKRVCRQMNQDGISCCLLNECRGGGDMASTGPRDVLSEDSELDSRLLRAARVPQELGFLNDHIFRRNVVHMTEPSSSVSSTHEVPLNSTGYAMAVDTSCLALDHAPKSGIISCNGYQIREVWVPSDGAAYRLWEFQDKAKSCSCEYCNGYVVLAATVIGTNAEVSRFLNHSWMNIEVLLCLLTSGHREKRSFADMQECLDVSQNGDSNESTLFDDDNVFSACTQEMDI